MVTRQRYKGVLTYKEGKSVAAERFIRSLKNTIYKYLTSISKNVYIDKLGDIDIEDINTYYRTIKMKPINFNTSICINFGVENDDKDPIFDVGDHV